jgi:DNA-binding transcriptional LysR family regulator
MNLSSINLNLIVILDAILTEQHISKAAKKINLSQPRISNALRELREIFDDELLIRTKHNQMILTEKAVKLKISVRNILTEVNLLFEENQPFNPAAFHGNFNILMSDYVTTTFLPLLTKYLNKNAPGITISTYTFDYIHKAPENILNSLNLIIAVHIPMDNHIGFNMKEFLFDDELVYTANSSHQIFKNCSDEKIEEFPCLEINMHDEFLPLNQSDNDANETSSIRRDIYWQNDTGNLTNQKYTNGSVTAMPVSNIMIACNILNSSDIICISPKKLLLPIYKHFNLNIKKLSKHKSKLEFYQYWKNNTDNKQSLVWLRKIIKQIAEES